jgi:hypothetical protein
LKGLTIPPVTKEMRENRWLRQRLGRMGCGVWGQGGDSEETSTLKSGCFFPCEKGGHCHGPSFGQQQSEFWPWDYGEAVWQVPSIFQPGLFLSKKGVLTVGTCGCKELRWQVCHEQQLTLGEEVRSLWLPLGDCVL